MSKNSRRRWNDADRAGIARPSVPDRCRAPFPTVASDRRRQTRPRSRPGRRRSASRCRAGAGWRGAAWHDADEASERHRPAARCTSPGSPSTTAIVTSASGVDVGVGQRRQVDIRQRVAVDDQEAIGFEQRQRARRAAGRAEDAASPTNSAPRGRVASRRRPRRVMVSARWCRLSTTRRMPARAQPRRMRTISGVPATGSAALARTADSGAGAWPAPRSAPAPASAPRSDHSPARLRQTPCRARARPCASRCCRNSKRYESVM